MPWRLVTTQNNLDSNACVVFIHGFQGNESSTWGAFPSLLQDDSSMQGWNILSFGYESNLAPDLTGIWEGDPCIQTIADSLATFANTQLDQYKAYVFIAHSMGGLAVQRALLDNPKLASKVDKVILFGTPSFGLNIAQIFQLPILRRLYRQARDMGKTSEFIQTLRKDWTCQFDKNPPFEFLAVAGAEDEFVPRSASIDNFPDNQCAVVPGNHIQIVKPNTNDDASLKVVTKFIKGEGLETERWCTSLLALERRDFQHIVDRFLPNKDKLDSRALVDLSLALDGLNRREEAMSILADAHRYGTDAMGVLAGRHKRIWLQERIDQEGSTALGLYSDAYKICQSNAPAQAYYHGINMAYLKLVYENNITEAQQVAEQVLTHCADAKSDEPVCNQVWRIATEAEANLILGNSGVSLQHYARLLDDSYKQEPWQFASSSKQALHIADHMGSEAIAKRLLEIFRGPSS